RASSVMERFPLTLLDSLVPDSVLGDSQRLAGTVSAVLEAASRGGRLEGRLVARADSVALRYQRVLDTAPRWIALDTAAAEFTVGAQGLQGKLYIHALHHDSVAAGWLSGTVALPRFTRLGLPLESQPIEAGIEGHIDTLGYAAEYFPGMDSLAGSVVLDAQLAGMAAAPTFEVRLDFDILF